MYKKVCGSSGAGCRIFICRCKQAYFWGVHSSGWQEFLAYTTEVDSFAPESSIPFLAVTSSLLETLSGIVLLIGYKTRLAAILAGILTLLFAPAISVSFGIKEPLDYSVFAVSTAGFLLSTVPYYKWSVDEKLIYSHKNKI